MGWSYLQGCRHGGRYVLNDLHLNFLGDDKLKMKFAILKQMIQSAYTITCFMSCLYSTILELLIHLEFQYSLGLGKDL